MINRRTALCLSAIAAWLLLHTTRVYSLEINLNFLFSVSRLNDGTALRDPLALAVSRASGDIIVADTGNDRLCIFNPDGVLIKNVGRLAGIKNPIGVAFGNNDDMYVTEMGEQQIKRLDFGGAPLPEMPPKRLDGMSPALGRLIFRDGSIYAVDRASPRVLMISEPAGETREIKQVAKKDEPAWKVQDVTVDAAGNIYVLSSQGMAVSVFDSHGSFIRSFGKHGSKEAEFSFPTGAEIGPDSNLWIVDSFRHEIKVFNPAGDFLFRWGATGPGEADLFYPIDIAFGKGILYVLEKGSSKLQAFAISQE